MASYKAHIRTHAGNGQDGLDLVSKKICLETSSSVQCRAETRCKTRRSSGISVAAGERARVVEEPHRVQSQVSAVADVRQVADRQSSAVSSPMGTLVRLCSPVDKVSRACEGAVFRFI